MQVKNITGVPQSLSGVILPPGKWLSVGQGLPEKVAWEAVRSRRAVFQVEPEDHGLWKDAQGTHLLWMSPLSQGDGYATAAENMLLALDRTGLKVACQTCWFRVDRGLDPRTIELSDKPLDKLYEVGVCMATPGEFKKLPTPYRIGITMYEADSPLLVHPEWERDCREVDRLVVPAEYNREVFSFFKGPIDVVPLAVNPIYYTAQKRLPGETFRVISHATMTGRKAPLEMIDVFQKAFPKEQYPDCRFTLKTRMGYCGWGRGQLPEITDERIEIISTTSGTDWSAAQLRDWMHQADCYLFLSKGEGYGMTPREALCTGLPTVFTDSTGMKELADSRYTFPVPVGKTEESPLGGIWRLADYDYAVDVLRWMYDHRETAYEKAQRGAEWFIQEHGADAAARQLRGLIEHVSHTPIRKTPKPEHFNPEAHREFLNRLFNLCPAPGPILDLNSYQGELKDYLLQQGYRVVSECQPFQVRNGHFPLAIWAGEAWRYSMDEIRRILYLASRRATNVLLSAPTLYHPGNLPGNLWRKAQWMDVVLPFERTFDYYGADNRYFWVHVTGVGRPNDGRLMGEIVDGVWRPRDAALKVR